MMKNCEPFVPGPAFAMERVKGRSWRSVRWISSSKLPPQIDSPLKGGIRRRRRSREGEGEGEGEEEVEVEEEGEDSTNWDI